MSSVVSGALVIMFKTRQVEYPDAAPSSDINEPLPAIVSHVLFLSCFHCCGISTHLTVSVNHFYA